MSEATTRLTRAGFEKGKLDRDVKAGDKEAI